MIVSNSKKFIFVHVPKTGGTSISYCLKKYSSYSVSGEYKLKNKPFLNVSLKKHAHMKHISKFLNSKEYFKFGFVRNPWDLFVSLYFWLKPRSKKLQKKSFERFIIDFYNNIENAVLMGGGQTPFLYDTNTCLVDFIGRFENYSKDVGYIFKKLGISIDLPVINKTKHKNYRKYYNKRTKDMIKHVCISDIDNFGYSF